MVCHLKFYARQKGSGIAPQAFKNGLTTTSTLFYTVARRVLSGACGRILPRTSRWTATTVGQKHLKAQTTAASVVKPWFKQPLQMSFTS